MTTHPSQSLHLAPAPAPATPVAQTRDQAPALGRDAFFDNAKLGLITLVVTGHAIEPFIRGDVALRALYLLIYAFHIPAFVLLAGHHSAKRLDAGRGQKLITGVVVPYLLFEVLYSVFEWKVMGRPLSFTFLTPYWLMWFLVSLFTWRLLLPVFASLRGAPLWGLVLALLAGTTAAGYSLSLSRTFTFLPFFLLGAWLRPEHFAALARPAVRVAAVAVLAAGAWLAYDHAPELRARWFYGAHSYAALKLDAADGALLRLSLLTAGAVLGVAFLALVPRRRSWLTKLGSRSLAVFLLHGFAIKLAVHLGYLRHGPNTWPVWAILALGPALTLLLASRPVAWLTRPLLAPRLSFLFRRAS